MLGSKLHELRNISTNIVGYYPTTLFAPPHQFIRFVTLVK